MGQLTGLMSVGVIVKISSNGVVCLEMEFLLDLMHLIWSVNDRLTTSVTSHSISQRHLKSDIAELLDETVSSFGLPKLFLVSCDLECLRELLTQVR